VVPNLQENEFPRLNAISQHIGEQKTPRNWEEAFNYSWLYGHAMASHEVDGLENPTTNIEVPLDYSNIQEQDLLLEVSNIQEQDLLLEVSNIQEQDLLLEVSNASIDQYVDDSEPNNNIAISIPKNIEAFVSQINYNPSSPTSPTELHPIPPMGIMNLEASSSRSIGHRNRKSLKSQTHQNNSLKSRSTIYARQKSTKSKNPSQPVHTQEPQPTSFPTSIFNPNLDHSITTTPNPSIRISTQEYIELATYHQTSKVMGSYFPSSNASPSQGKLPLPTNVMNLGTMGPKIPNNPKNLRTYDEQINYARSMLTSTFPQHNWTTWEPPPQDDDMIQEHPLSIDTTMLDVTPSPSLSASKAPLAMPSQRQSPLLKRQGRRPRHNSIKFGTAHNVPHSQGQTSIDPNLLGPYGFPPGTIPSIASNLIFDAPTSIGHAIPQIVLQYPILPFPIGQVDQINQGVPCSSLPVHTREISQETCAPSPSLNVTPTNMLAPNCSQNNECVSTNVNSNNISFQTGNSQSSVGPSSDNNREKITAMDMQEEEAMSILSPNCLPSNLVEQATFICQQLTTRNWDQLLHPRLLGTCMVLMPMEKLATAWDEMQPLNSQDHVMINNFRVELWSPLMFLHSESRTYKRYFPVVIERFSHKVLAFDQFTREQNLNMCEKNPYIGWFGFPSLDWIHDYLMDHVIAASNGLLVIDSGKEPSSKCKKKKHPRHKVPNHEFWNQTHNFSLKGQSLLVVCNALTKEYKILPPLVNKVITGKAGVLSFENVNRDIYHLIIIGWVYEQLTSEQRAQMNATYGIGVYASNNIHKMVLAIYSSQQNIWVHLDSIDHARPAHQPNTGGHICCVVINRNVYFGGFRIQPVVTRMDEVETPALFYINATLNHAQRLVFDFSVQSVWNNIPIVEPPKVVRVGANKIYAATRQITKNMVSNGKILLVEVILNDDWAPTGVYGMVPNGMMPDSYVIKLYIDEFALSRVTLYDIVGGDNLIAFFASKLSLPNIVFYHIERAEWTNIIIPMNNCNPARIVGRLGYFDYMEGSYEPNWGAIP
jgi:hypothetical protein